MVSVGRVIGGQTKRVAVRRVERRRSLPGTRAVVGALLMALAAVGVFVATTGAASGPGTSYVVAATALPPGHLLTEADLDLAPVDLEGGVGAAAFSDLDELVGRVTLGPVGAGELVQSSAVSTDVAFEPGHEVALLLPRAQVAAVRLQPGDRVDLYATTDTRTKVIARNALLVGAGGPSGGAIAEEREVELVVSVPAPDVVTEVVHALRTADVTVVRSTTADAGG